MTRSGHFRAPRGWCTSYLASCSSSVRADRMALIETCLPPEVLCGAEGKKPAADAALVLKAPSMEPLRVRPRPVSGKAALEGGVVQERLKGKDGSLTRTQVQIGAPANLGKQGSAVPQESAADT